MKGIVEFFSDIRFILTVTLIACLQGISCKQERYANSQGVAQDHQQAVKCYRLAADQGFAEAQYNLGQLYYANGQGVTVATTGQAMQKGIGWRKALRAALADNPFVKGEGLSPKARRELLGHSQMTLGL